MNLRTLKKLSKRAAVLLPLMGDNREQFSSERGDGHLSHLISDRKHWDRSHCHASYTPRNDYQTPRGMPIKHVTRAGRTIVIRPPSTPLKGTVMVGGMSGGEQPEWDEETAWAALSGQVWWHFSYFHPETGDIVSKRDFPTPRDTLLGAAEIIARRRLEAGGRS